MVKLANLGWVDGHYIVIYRVDDACWKHIKDLEKTTEKIRTGLMRDFGIDIQPFPKWAGTGTIGSTTISYP